MHGASGALTGSGMSESMAFAGLATFLKSPLFLDTVGAVFRGRGTR